MKIQLAALLLLCSAIASAQVLPGRDAYVVRTAAKQLTSGRQLPPSAMVVQRPPANTYAENVVIVKTRGVYGTLQHGITIEGSIVSSVLAGYGITDVSSAYPTPANASDADVRLASEIGLDRVYTVRYSSQTDAFDVCLKLMTCPDVEYAMPMLFHKQNLTPNDPLFAQQVWMKTMKLEEAWDVSKGNANVVIGIVDSGTDWTHEDLAGKIKLNTAEIDGNGIDDDKNGFVDDVRGWDFVGNITPQEAYAGVLRPDNDPRVNYPVINGTNAHGTATAGCAAATTNNAKGIAGSGFDCRILPVKVGSDNPNVGGLLAGYQGIKYAADMGAQVINCSWGGTTDNPGGQEMIQYCLAKGALVVAASGNEGLFTGDVPHYPSSFDGLLSVGSCGNSGSPSSFSNYGYDVTTYAPGENILTSYPNNQYQAASGTSFSCPLVAGICGLIKSKHPDWTPEMIIQQIRSTSDAMPGVSAADRPKYFGRANAKNALKYNNSFTSGDRIPGIAMQSLSIGAGGQINNYEPTAVSVVLKNYLADASNVSITVQSLGSGLEVTSGGGTTIPLMLHDATSTLNLTVKLLPTFPWYQAQHDFLLTVQSPGYTNYVIVRVPISLPTSNSHYLVSSNQYLTMDLADMTADGTLWATGTYLGANAMITGNETGAGGVIAAPYKPTAMFAVNSSTALVGARQGTKSDISITRNAKDWMSADVSTSMTSVAGIGLMDEFAGFAIGNPIGGRIGIAKTTDGGLTWQKVSNSITANANEEVLNSVVFSNANGMYAATSARRIIYTQNKGASWSSSILNVPGAQILSVAVDDSLNGALVYSVSGINKVATSEKGGAWKPDAVNLAALGITPVAVASPGKHLVLVGANGEVFGSDNAGKDWQIILSKQPGTTARAIAHTSQNTTLVTSGENIGILTYRYSGPNGSKILSASSDTVNYGNLESGQNRLRSIKVESIGESNVTLQSVTIAPHGSTPADAYRVVNALDSIILAGASDNLGVRLYATDTGIYNATVTIVSDATPSTTVIELVGVVTPAVSVAELKVDLVAVFPNPAAEYATVVLPQSASIALYNLEGIRVRNYGTTEAGKQLLSLAGLATGRYTLVIELSSGPITVPLTRMP